MFEADPILPAADKVPYIYNIHMEKGGGVLKFVKCL